MSPTPVATFLPNTGDLQSTLWWSAALAGLGLLGCLGLLYRPGRGRNRNYRLLGAMLLFFVFMIAASTGFFSWLNQQRTGPVYLYQDAIETAMGRADFADIRQARITMAGNRSLFDPEYISGGQRLLTIEEKGGRVHVLSEAHYPVEEILRSLRTQVKAWEAAERE